MSKLSFRARQVDYSKPLPIYYNNEIPDLQDFAAINRSVPQMPTGMEKDEEAEHHLQRALSALQVYGATTSNEYAIPTPNVEIDNKMYESIYSVECPKQKQYIRIQPFSNDFDYPDYDADIEDEQWLKEYKNKLPDDFTDDLFLFFENTMDRLEKAVGFSTNLMSRDEAKMLLLENDDQTEDLTTTNDTTDRNKYKTERDEFILCIYEYWKLKRLKCNHPLTPTVLTDKCGVVTAPNNPYLVFRRRTEKMQTRKNRKTEEQSYEKMLILKRDLVRAQQLLKLVKQREAVKKDFIKLTLETFEKRLKSNDYDGTLTETIKSNILKTKSPAVQAIILQSKANTDKKLSSLVKSPSVKRELADTKLMQTVNTKRLKKDKKLSPVNINTIQPVVKSATTPSTTKTTLANLFKSDKNKRFIRRPIGAPSTPAKVDSDLCESKTPSPVRCEPLTTQDIEYNEELRQNNIENLDSALTEAKSLFSTSVEKDGYWSFKRKEGCKYLAQNGSIFKNDAFDRFSNLELDETKRPKKENVHQLRRHAYGYLVSKKRHLGLVRRRYGRGGRILLDKINPQSLLEEETTNSTESNKFHSLDNLSQFKTYNDNGAAVVPAAGTTTSDHLFYDHRMFGQMNPAQEASTVDLYELEPLLAIKNFDMDDLFESDSDTKSYLATPNCVKVDFRPDFNEPPRSDEHQVRMVALRASLKNFIPVKQELVKPEAATRHLDDKPIKIETKLLNVFNSSGSTFSTLINKLNEPLIRPIINGSKYSSTSTSSLPSSSASSSSSSSPLSNSTTTKPNANTTSGSNSASYLYTSAQSSLTLNPIGSKGNKFEIF